ALYFINGRGLEGLPVGMDAETSTLLPQEDTGFAFSEAEETTEGSQSLAADTGGFTIRNSNDLAGGFRRIAEDTRAYYLVGYNPKNTARDGAFRKIQVKVPGRKGLQIRARKGYFAPSDEPATARARDDVDPAFQQAIDSPYEKDDIPPRMTDFVREETLKDKARVYVATEVDVRGVALQQTDGRTVRTLH